MVRTRSQRNRTESETISPRNIKKVSRQRTVSDTAGNTDKRTGSEASKKTIHRENDLGTVCEEVSNEKVSEQEKRTSLGTRSGGHVSGTIFGNVSVDLEIMQGDDLALLRNTNKESNKKEPEMKPGDVFDGTQTLDDDDCEKFVQNDESDKAISKAKRKNPFYFPPAKTLVPSVIQHTSIDVGDISSLPGSYLDVNSAVGGKKKIEKLYSKLNVDSKSETVKGTVITPNFEVNFENAGDKPRKEKWKEGKAERDSNAGKDWYNLKPPEMTDGIKRDLQILQMRGVLDPKRFYKHNDRKVLPKYFQVGKIKETSADFYSSRETKKQRKSNLTDELLADAEFQRYQKRKYNEIQIQKKAMGEKRRRLKKQKRSKRAKTAF